MSKEIFRVGLLPGKPLDPFGVWMRIHCIPCSHGGAVRRQECSIHNASITSEVPQNRVQLAPVHPSVEHPSGPPTHQQAPDKPAIFCACAIVVSILHTFPSPNGRTAHASSYSGMGRRPGGAPCRTTCSTAIMSKRCSTLSPNCTHA